MKPIVELKSVSKKFLMHLSQPHSFMEIVTGWARPHPAERKEFWALRNVSLAIARGETLGIVGDNGTGKSTLLKLVARIIEPTSGRIAVDGRVGALLEVGVGFHPDLTGRENIFLSGAIIGLSRQDMLRRVDEIIAFSGIGEFVDVPIRHYSSGMLVRLGFSVATSLNPDILLVDEVLAVGDQAFRQQCLHRIDHMRSQGTAILYVSHNLEEIRRVCDRAVWLHKGSVELEGHPDEVVHTYLNFTLRERGLKVWELGGEQERGRHLGSGEVEIIGAVTLDGEGRPCHTYTHKAPFVLRIDYKLQQPVKDCAFGLSIYAEDGTWVTSPNSVAQDSQLHVGESGSVYYVLDELPLRAGSYEVTVAAFDPTASMYKPYDHQHRRYSFEVKEGAAHQDGLVELPHRWLDEFGWKRLQMKEA